MACFIKFNANYSGPDRLELVGATVLVINHMGFLLPALIVCAQLELHETWYYGIVVDGDSTTSENIYRLHDDPPSSLDFLNNTREIERSDELIDEIISQDGAGGRRGYYYYAVLNDYVPAAAQRLPASEEEPIRYFQY